MLNNIKELRGSRKLSLQALADKAECSKPHIWELEKGMRCPSLALAYRVSRALGYRDVTKVFPNPY